MLDRFARTACSALLFAILLLLFAATSAFADVKINALPTMGAPNGSEVVPVYGGQCTSTQYNKTCQLSTAAIAGLGAGIPGVINVAAVKGVIYGTNDFCDKLMSAAIQGFNTYPNGVVLDARGLTGTQSCAQWNPKRDWPVGSDHYATVVLLNPSLYLLTSVSFLMPTEMHIDGGVHGWGRPCGPPNAYCGGATIQIADATVWPSETPVVDMGWYASPPNLNPPYAIRVENLSISCTDPNGHHAADVIGLRNGNSQENTGTRDLEIEGCTTGFMLDQQSLNPGDGQNHCIKNPLLSCAGGGDNGLYDGLYIFPASPSSVPALNPPTAPVLSYTAGGSLGSTTYVVGVTYENMAGETTLSGTSTITVPANNLLVVTSPAPVNCPVGSTTVACAPFYNVYVGISGGSSPGRQNPVQVHVGTNWTMSTAGWMGNGPAGPINNTTEANCGVVNNPSGGVAARIANGTCGTSGLDGYLLDGLSSAIENVHFELGNGGRGINIGSNSTELLEYCNPLVAGCLSSAGVLAEHMTIYDVNIGACGSGPNFCTVVYNTFGGKLDLFNVSVNGSSTDYSYYQATQGRSGSAAFGITDDIEVFYKGWGATDLWGPMLSAVNSHFKGLVTFENAQNITFQNGNPILPNPFRQSAGECADAGCSNGLQAWFGPTGTGNGEASILFNNAGYANALLVGESSEGTGTFDVRAATNWNPSTHLGTWQDNFLVYTGGTIQMPHLPVETSGGNYFVCASSSYLGFYTTSGSCTSSSLRFKRDWHPLTDPLARVMRLEVGSFHYKDAVKDDALGEQIGFNAENMAKVEPRLALYDKEGRPTSVEYDNAAALIAAALQEEVNRAELRFRVMVALLMLVTLVAAGAWIRRSH